MVPKNSNRNGNWFQIQRPVANPTLRLFCFSYAGGSASIYRDWHKHLPEDVEVCSVQLPGRGARFTERSFTSLGPMIDALEQAIDPYTKVPYAFFGHSMGAQLAFELTRRLRDRGIPEPQCLILSGRKAPQLQSKRKPIHTLPESEFREEVKRLNGTPDEALNNQELMDIVSPILRADFQAIETWEYTPSNPITVPMFVMGGVKDKNVTLDDLEEWRQVSTGPFGLELFSGDHFFINQATDSLLKSINKAINSVLGRAEGLISR